MLLAGILIAIVAALAYNVGLAMQSDPLQAAPAGMAAVRALLRSPLFVVGFLMTGVGFGLEVLALHYQPLAMVQPILAAGVLALPPAEKFLHKQRIRPTLVLAIAAIVAGIALVSTAVDHGADPTLPTTTIAGIWLVIVAALVLPLATSLVPPPLRAALSGIGFGAVATMMKLVAVTDAGTPLWWLAVAGILVVGPASLLGEFSALRDLRPALVAPVVLAISTIVAETAAVCLLHEHLVHAPWLVVGLVPCIAGAAWVAATASASSTPSG